MNINIEIITTSASILSNEALLVGLIDSPLKLDLLVPELTSHVDVGSLGSHAESDHECTLDELVRVVSQNFSIFACTGLRLVTVNHKIGGTAVGDLGHEGVLETAGEAGTASATETRLLDLINDPIWAIEEDILGLMPVSLKTIFKNEYTILFLGHRR